MSGCSQPQQQVSVPTSTLPPATAEPADTTDDTADEESATDDTADEESATDDTADEESATDDTADEESAADDTADEMADDEMTDDEMTDDEEMAADEEDVDALLEEEAPAELSSWEFFTSEEGRFTVRMPSEPIRIAQTQETMFGDIEVVMFQAMDDNAQYMVAYSYFGEDMMALLTDPMVALEGVAQGAFGALGGEIEASEEVSLDGYPGIETAAVADLGGEEITMKGRFFQVEDELFQVIAAGPTDSLSMSEVNGFLKSFALIEGEAPATSEDESADADTDMGMDEERADADTDMGMDEERADADTDMGMDEESADADANAESEDSSETDSTSVFDQALAEEKGWEQFSSETGGFSVWMPGEPMEQTQQQATAVGDIELTMFQVVEADGVYAVGFNDFPEEWINMVDNDSDTLLSSSAQGAFGAIGGEIETMEDITLSGYPGKEAMAMASYGGVDLTVKGRFYLVENRLYQVFAAVSSETASLEDIDLFLSSFELDQ
jgi:hypothetical protein